MLFGSTLIGIAFGGKYAAAGPILTILAFNGIFSSLGVVGNKWIITENIQKYIMLNTCMGAVLNVILNILFIKQFGIIGSAYASLIARFFAGYLFDAFFKRTRPLFWYKTKAAYPSFISLFTKLMR
jgi:O-antigen/teichoic acid export membrane protein